MSGDVLCRCGGWLHPTNWADGVGWQHRNGDSMCRIAPTPIDRVEGDRVLREYAKATRSTVPDYRLSSAAASEQGAPE